MKKLGKILLFITIALIPIYVLRFKLFSIPTTVLELLIYITFATVFIGDFAKMFKASKNPIFKFGLIFVLTGLIAVFIDPNRTNGLGLFKAYFFDGFLMFWLVLANVEDRQSIIAALVTSGAIAALGSLTLYCFGIKTEDGRLLDLDRLSPNYLAMYLTPIFVISAYKSVFARVKDNKFLFIAASIIILLAIWLTGSRGVVVGILFTALFIIFKLLDREIKGSSKILIRSLFAIIAIAIAAALFSYFAPDWSDHARKATSSNIRYYIWVTSLEIGKLNPIFGVGLSNYQNYFSNLTHDRVNYPEFISPQALTAHNLYLQIYLTMGILGVVTFLALIIKSRFWAQKDLAISAAFVAILAYGLVDTPFFRNDLSLVFWIILALTYLKP